VHDLKPSVETANELVIVLEEIASHDPNEELLSQLKEGLQKLNQLIETVKKYMIELDDEAKSSGIMK